MRRILVLAAALIVTPALATEVSIKMEDAAQNVMLQLPSLLDQCVSGLTLRGDATVCKGVANVLNALSNDTRAAQAAAKAAADAKTAAEAKAAEEAKKDKPAEQN